MQHTQNYKLNLIESDDVFSPAPLNENAEKTEAEFARLDEAMAACRAEHWFVKIAGPLVAQSYAEELELDLSGIDMSQFLVLLVVARSEPYAAFFRVNHDTKLWAILNTTVHRQGSIAVFMQSNDDRIVYYNRSVSGITTASIHDDCGFLTCAMADIKTLTFYGKYDAGSRFTVYGIKA